MKYSNLFGKTVREAKVDMTAKSHKLLYQAGFIRESRAGRYYFLPLGQRVQDKICAIVEDEMAKAGSQKMFAPVLHPIELWQETNRDDAGGYELMTVKDRAGAQFALGGTAEEMFVDVVRGFQISYKELPMNLYQFGYKFRDELRARGGLLRVREFLMKDAYSFHADNVDFEKEYKNMWKAYENVFKRVGLEVKVVPADNGYFGGEYCHEFIVDSEIGESRYFEAEDGSYIAHEDIAVFAHKDMSEGEEVLTLEEVDQSEDVNSMEDNVAHYKKPLHKFLKNVVYKNRITGELVVVVIRGDLEVNKNKLEKALDMIGLLETATDDDLWEVLKVKSGAVRSWGHADCLYVADLSLSYVKNMIGGQKNGSKDCINVNYERDFSHEINIDCAVAQEGFFTETGARLVAKKGIEAGNIFQLGQHYSKKMANAVFTDKDGKLQEFFMGCYGLGIGRILSSAVEIFADDKGIVWPKSIAPFQVHLLPLDAEGEVFEMAKELYKKLGNAGIEVLMDDRDARPGIKFNDSELIGIPVRVVIGRKSLENKQLEVKIRETGEEMQLTEDQLIKFLEEFYA